MFIPGWYSQAFQNFQQSLTPFNLDLEASGEETKVRLRWSWCQQARHSSEETQALVNYYELLCV